MNSTPKSNLPYEKPTYRTHPLFALSTHGQIIFEKGYFINNEGEKIDCFIKNHDWKNNPIEFEYQLNLNAEIHQAGIENVKEFGVYGYDKYIRARVLFDSSSRNINDLTYEKAPILQEQTLYLRPLVEGSSNLYVYKNKDSSSFFFAKEGGSIQLLIYRKYLLSENKIGENNQFKRQLWSEFKCVDITHEQVEHMDYHQNDLMRFFIQHNECHGNKYVRFDHKKKRNLFNLSIRPGLNFTSLAIANSRTNSRDTDFGAKTTLRLGIEAAILLPFNKNKWALFVEPTYQEFKAIKEGDLIDAEVDYRSIELPIGLRHYFFLNEQSKLFVNGAFILDFIDDAFIYFNDVPTFKLNAILNYGLGVGYQYNDRFGVELRYHTNRELIKDFASWSSNYQTVSFIFGYSLF